MSNRSNLLRLATMSGFSVAILAGAVSVGHAKVSAQDSTTVLGPRAPASAFTARVAYADLNLAEKSGRQELRKRVDNATRKVCAGAAFSPALTIGEQFVCRDYAWVGARPQIKRAVLRAQQIAANGTSAIQPVAIAINFAL